MTRSFRIAVLGFSLIPYPSPLIPVFAAPYRYLSEQEFDLRMAAKPEQVHPRFLTREQAREDLKALQTAVEEIWRHRWDKKVRKGDVSWIAAKAEAALPKGRMPFGEFVEIANTFMNTLNDAHAYVMVAGDELGRISEKSVPVHWNRLAPDIGLIRIDRFPEPGQPYGDRFPEFIDKAFQGLQDTQGILLDLRRNAGGDPNQADRLFDHLASTPVFLYYEVVRRSDAMERYLGKEKVARWEWEPGTGFSKPFAVTYEPEDPGGRYRGKVLALADGGTVSAGEYVLQELLDNGLARFAGERTPGHTGSVVPAELPNSRLVVALPIQHVLRKNLSSIQGRGVVPQYHLDPSAPDVIEKATTILREWIKRESRIENRESR